MNSLLGFLLCFVAVVAVTRSFLSGRGLSSVGTWIAILLLFPGLLMAFSGANIDSFLGELPIIGPVLNALGLISTNTTKNDWIDFILTTQIACLISFTCWGANGFFENLVMKIIVSFASYLLLLAIKLALASALPEWGDIGLIALMILLFIILFQGGMLMAFLSQVFIVVFAIGVLGMVLAGSIAFVDAALPLLSPITVIVLIILGIFLLR